MLYPRLLHLCHKNLGNNFFSYCFVDSSEKVDLILKGVNLGLKLNLFHVGIINFL